MPTPADHAELLRRADYPVPTGATLTDAERQTVGRFGYWMQALTAGTIAPATPEQEHFVLAARGMEDPTTAFEIAWEKVRLSAALPATGLTAASSLTTGTREKAWQSATVTAAPASLTAVARQLDETRATAIALRQADLSRRLDILAKVQPEIDALDAEMSGRLKPLEAEMARLETLLKDGVRAAGQSFRYKDIRVTYYRARITFDNTGLQAYSVSNPDILRFRKVGQPTAYIRYVAADAPPPQRNDEADADSHPDR